jgi:hypothetical protein
MAEARNDDAEKVGASYDDNIAIVEESVVT